MSPSTGIFLPNALLMLALAGCAQTEDGVNDSILTGTVVLAPGVAEEGQDGTSVQNDALPVSLPTMTYRALSVAGVVRNWGATWGEEGDVDPYSFVPVKDGTLTVRLNYETGRTLSAATKAELFDGSYTLGQHDTRTFRVDVYDPNDPGGVDADGVELPTESFESDGSFGQLTFDLEVVKGARYKVVVVALYDTEQTAQTPYTLWFSGMTPEDGDVTVGAYLSSSLSEKGNPVGGAAVSDYVWDEASTSWTGQYRILFLKKVTSCEVGDAECISAAEATGVAARSAVSGRASTSDTGAGADTGTGDGGKASDGGGSGGSDTGGDGGTSSDTGGDGGTSSDGGGADSGDGGGADSGDGGASDSGDGGADTGDGGSDDGGSADGGADGGSGDGGASDGGSTSSDSGAEPEMQVVVTEQVDSVYLIAGTFGSLSGFVPSGTYYSSTALYVDTPGGAQEVADAVVVDDLSPKVYGWSTAEVEPNNVGDAFSDPISSLDLAQALPQATGIGVTDTITGKLEYATDNPGYAGETDAFAFTVPEAMGGYITGAWTNASANLDLTLYDSTGAFVWAGYFVADSNPEILDIAAHAEYTLEPGNTYYLQVLPWTGDAGDQPYSIEIEWTSP